MNEFFRKWHYEYLLEQMCEISLELRVGREQSGTHKKEKRHLFLGENRRSETILPCQGFRGLPFSLLFAIMKNLRMLSIFFVFSMFAGSWGCSSNSTSVNIPPPTVPPDGSTFTTSDNNSNTTFDTVVAISSGFADTAHHGSTSVEISVTLSSNSGNNVYYESFLTDGDVALEGSSWGASGIYEVLPFTTHADGHRYV